MSIEAMKQVIELYDKHCYNNDYGGIEFNKNHGYKFIEAIEALRTAIQQAEAKTDESVAWLNEMLADTKEVFDANGTETPQVVRDVIEYVASWIIVYNEKHHPAPGVPDALKDHQIAATVNTLRDIARQFHGHDSLRERIANVLVPAIKAEAQQPAQSVNEKHFCDFELLVVTTAYEQGFGHAFRTELSNPYAPATNAYKAWDMGRSAGKRNGQPQHPDPGVPDRVARDAERYRWLLCNYLKFSLPDEAWKHGSLDAAIDAAMTASPAQKGGE